MQHVSFQPSDDSATAARGFVTSYGLVEEDLKRFSTFGDAVVRIVPIRVLPTEARYLDRMANTRVIATVPEYADVTKLELASGRFLTEADDAELRNVCVLGFRSGGSAISLPESDR